jgi:hypothetical protein
MASAPASRPVLERAILEALTYSDIFDHPLRPDELQRYLPVYTGVDELPTALDALQEYVGRRDGVYFLAGREEIVKIRRQREARSRKLMPHAIRYGKILGGLPFVRMVALTGSLAVQNVSKDADFDYMLVTAQGRLWTARAFALLLNRLVRQFGHTICPNLILSESALEWHLHDLYSARELVQMIPIAGMDIYRKLMLANEWVRDFLPNGFMDSVGLPPKLQEQTPALQGLLEVPLRGRIGTKFETWEMSRKIARFSKQPGFGEETIFTAEVCQGNFHHHRKWTREAFEEKLRVIASRSERREAIPSFTEIASSPIGSSQ